jgi:hypothetical protein
VGDFFTSFDDAWSHFTSRSEPLEDFFADFPEDRSVFLEGWLVEPQPAIKTAVVEIQRELSDFDWLVPIPPHFLHVWIGLCERIGDAWRGWLEVEPFSTTYRRVNCFHSAVVVEVEGTGMRRLVVGTPNDLPTFLPHMTVAVVREPRPPQELREVLGRLRESILGDEIVREAKLARFPAARTTLFRPWTVEQVVSLG